MSGPSAFWRSPFTLFASEGGAAGPATSNGYALFVSLALGRRLLAVLGYELHVQGQALQLLHEHVEGFRRTRLEEVLSFHDGLVDPVPTLDIVRLDREHLLQGVGGSIGFQRPHLHLTEALAAELRLATQRLLGDEGVRPDRPRVHLVVHEVGELQDVDLAHRHLLMEWLARPPVEEARLARLGQAGLLQVLPDLAFRG